MELVLQIVPLNCRTSLDTNWTMCCRFEHLLYEWIEVYAKSFFFHQHKSAGVESHFHFVFFLVCMLFYFMHLFFTVQYVLLFDFSQGFFTRSLPLLTLWRWVSATSLLFKKNCFRPPAIFLSVSPLYCHWLDLALALALACPVVPYGPVVSFG